LFGKKVRAIVCCYLKFSFSKEESMVKKIALISLAVVLMLAMANIASAKPSVANTSQKGSLLVFPKVIAFDNGTTGAEIDTYFFIGNDNTVGTWVKCYWMDNNQTVQDFFFYLTANQPVVFSSFWGSSDYVPIPPFRGIGTLTCWAAKDDDSAPIKFNHLYGNAMIRYGDTATANAGKAIFYNAYSFAADANLPNPNPNIANQYLNQLYDIVGDSSLRLRLTGDAPPVAQRGYDACPQYLVFNFIPDGNALAAGYKPDLTLWPCRQDLRQDRIPTCTKAKFDIWNENEVKFTGTYQCFKCFFEGFLTDIGASAFLNARGPGYGGTKFTDAVLKTQSARARVQGIYSSVCVSSNTTGLPAVTPKTKVIGGIGCPNLVDGARTATFNEAWGLTSAAITPLLGVVMYAADETVIDPTNPIRIRPHGAFTPFGAGSASWNADGSFNQNGGWIKYDPGAGALETSGR